ncbi:MAG: amidohydrolase family protein [Chloroflexi bacterium]|nr:amidohydrolase family protein [Chloroflexota bacterium]
MTKSSTATSASIRAKLKHPVIDADGHLLEMGPVLVEYLRQIGGQAVADRFLRTENASNELLLGRGRWHDLTPQQRRAAGLTPPAWWSFPTRNTVDRASVSLPRLLRSRMDDLGLDFSVLYPTMGMGLAGIADEELRRAACRAYNTYVSETYHDCRDRMTPVAVIPMVTPAEAIAEIEHATRALGLKAVMIGIVRRATPSADERWFSHRIDALGFESDYDYDPVWAKCIECKVAAVSHSTARGWDGRRSPTNGIFNHLGHFAAAGEALCRAIFMGGVTRRFPTLNFAFLEGGVAWGSGLYNGLIAHWEKRNVRALRENLDPALLDRDLLVRLIAEYGHAKVKTQMAAMEQQVRRIPPGPAQIDEWATCQIEQAEDIRDLFVPHFFFGCEADDPMNACAFDTKMNKFGVRLQAILGSDIGHWDVPDMDKMLVEAHELVEHNLISENDFTDFVFTNPARLHAGMNPDFFAGTVVEGAVRGLQANRGVSRR